MRSVFDDGTLILEDALESVLTRSGMTISTNIEHTIIESYEGGPKMTARGRCLSTNSRRPSLHLKIQLVLISTIADAFGCD
jgi:hypothetical protein